MTLYWMHYTGGVVGISLCSLWLLRHSRLMGSSDIDNWISEAKDSTLSFWNDHVEQPVSFLWFSSVYFLQPLGLFALYWMCSFKDQDLAYIFCGHSVYR